MNFLCSFYMRKRQAFYLMVYFAILFSLFVTTSLSLFCRTHFSCPYLVHLLQSVLELHSTPDRTTQASKVPLGISYKLQEPFFLRLTFMPKEFTVNCYCHCHCYCYYYCYCDCRLWLSVATVRCDCRLQLLVVTVIA